MPPPLPFDVSALSFLAMSLYPGMLRKESEIVELVQLSVIAIMSGSRSMAVALSSSIFAIILRAFVKKILRLWCWFDSDVAMVWGTEIGGELWAVLSISYAPCISSTPWCRWLSTIAG